MTIEVQHPPWGNKSFVSGWQRRHSALGVCLGFGLVALIYQCLSTSSGRYMLAL